MNVHPQIILVVCPVSGRPTRNLANTIIYVRVKKLNRPTKPKHIMTVQLR